MVASRATALNIRHPAAMRWQRATWLTPIMRPWPAAQRQQSSLPAVIFALKVVAGALAAATIISMLWQHDGTSVAPSSLEPNRFDAAFAPFRQQSTAYGRVPHQSQRPVTASEAEALAAALERALPSNFPRRVQTVRFTPPAHQPVSAAAVDPLAANPLAGKPLRYLIGAEGAGPGRDAEVTAVSYDAGPAKRGISIAYGNLFDERNTRRYGPYLHSSDTAAQYNEGQIDPRGSGWEKNLREQFERRRKQGFAYIELDNPDAYSAKDVIGAIELAASYGLKVIAKNPLLLRGGAVAYLAHPNVYGVIVERGAGSPDEMEALRRKAGKPTLPVWFVAFGRGRGWAGSVASAAKHYHNMGVTYSSAGEYGNAIDILPPA